MISPGKILSLALALPLMLGAGFVHAGTVQHALSPALAQQSFATPEAAMQALIQAVSVKDHAAIKKIFGADAGQLLSGDRVEDNRNLEDFANGAREFAQLQQKNKDYILVIGHNKWPFPVPIVKQGTQWVFDTQAGIDEILNRRIGENELSAIATCRAYVVAQWEYFTENDWNHDGVAAYAPKFISSPGQHDGLYWKTAAGEKLSPLGTLVASAHAEGYGSKGHKRPGRSRSSPAPYHGYYFRILSRQGPHAPGGKYNYIINGNMIAGYALVAYPDKWGNSGVMTLIVNQQGRVYQKNLGPDTAKLAAAMIAYDPDHSWELVKP